MKIGQKVWTKEKGWEDVLPQVFPVPPQFILVFGGRKLLEDKKHFKEIRSFYPDSHIVECSTAGEILGNLVINDSIAATAVLFEKTQINFVEADIGSADQSAAVGKKLAKAISKKALAHVMVFSDGLRVNGTALAKGLNDNLPPNVSVTGGLVGDGPDFKKTVVGLDRTAEEGKIVLVGFSGTKLKVGYGSFGGWYNFGIKRVITRSKDNKLYELDGKPALELYKTYLGDKAKGLPSTGLLFPLRLHLNHGDKTEVVRAVLGVNEADQSMTFAGDMPEGATVTLMKANPERLIDGAYQAGNMSVESLPEKNADLAILVSCVGRKLILKERTVEEVEAVRSALGEKSAISGFYSYGELCPTNTGKKHCHLHNQTMTVTTLKEELS